MDPDERVPPPYKFFAILAGLPEKMLNGDIKNYLSQLARNKDALINIAW